MKNKIATSKRDVVKRQMLYIFLLLIGLVNVRDVLANSPEHLVVAFQHDYKAWNDLSFNLYKVHNHHDVMLAAEKSWNALLNKYTRPDFRGEPIAFGSESGHDPSLEKIISTEVNENRAIITTLFHRQYYSPVYEYNLIKENEKWYLSQIYLVDEEGKYPEL